MSAKDIVKTYYESDIAKDDHILDLFDKDVKVQWHSSQGYTVLDYKKIQSMVSEIKRSFVSYGFRLSHLLEDGDMVTARYSIYVTPIERQEKEDVIAHFISIWKVKDGKLMEGYEISQLADASNDSLRSFTKIIE